MQNTKRHNYSKLSQASDTLIIAWASLKTFVFFKNQTIKNEDYPSLGPCKAFWVLASTTFASDLKAHVWEWYGRGLLLSFASYGVFPTCQQLQMNLFLLAPSFCLNLLSTASSPPASRSNWIYPFWLLHFVLICFLWSLPPLASSCNLIYSFWLPHFVQICLLRTLPRLPAAPIRLIPFGSEGCTEASWCPTRAQAGIVCRILDFWELFEIPRGF
jgi:hypothetical protein